MSKHALRPVVVDLAELVRSVNGAAYARAAALHTTMDYEQFDANAVVSFLAEAITSEPGFAMVKQDQRAIQADRQTFAAKYLSEAISASTDGPAALTAYLTKMDQERRNSLMRVNSVFNGVSNIDDEILAKLTFAMHTLLVIRFGATAALVVIPLLPIFVAGLEISAGASLVISLGYGLGQDAIKDYHRDAPPNVVAFDATGEFAKAGRDGAIEVGKAAATRNVATQSNLLIDAQRQIDTLSKRLARGQTPGKTQQLMRRLDRSEAAAADASRALRNASTAKVVLGKIPIVFAAVDIYSAYHEMKDDW